MRTVYIETDHAGQPLNPNLYAAFDGFSKKAYDTKFFYLTCPATSPDEIVCGTVGTVHRAWRQMGVPLPDLLDYPPQLESYLGRRICSGTLGEVRRAVFGIEDPAPVFVKPRLAHKLFTGKVIRVARDLIESAPLDDETAVWLGEPVSFVTEYRLFVLHGKLVGAKHYAGDFTRLIDFDVARAALADFADSPVAYSLDFGLTTDGRTLLVEANDSFALGNYGLDSFLYASMIEARWDEVVGVLPIHS